MTSTPAAETSTPTGRSRDRLVQVLVTAALLAAGMLVALVGQSLIAFYFGAGRASDALFMARDISELASKLLLPAQASGILVPLFVTLRVRSGDEQAWRALGAVLAAVALAATPVVLLVLAAAPLLVALLAPGFDGPARALTTDLLRILAPGAWFLVLGTLAAGVLQSRDRFGRAMLANLLGATAVVAGLPPLVAVLDVSGAAIAILVGAAVQSTLAWAFLLREGLPALPSPGAAPAVVGDFLRRAVEFWPFVAAALAGGAALRIAASGLATGLYASLALAMRLHRAIIALVLSPLQQVLLPALALSEASERRRDADNALIVVLRQLLFVVAPLVTALLVLREPVVSVVFERGGFTAGDAEGTARILGALALATIPTGVYLMLEQAAYARRQSTLVARTNVAVELVQGALYFPAIALLGAPGVAVAFAAGTSVASAVYLLTMRPSGAGGAAVVLRFLGQILLCCAALAAAAHGVRTVVNGLVEPPGGLSQAVVLLPATLAGALAYAVAAHVVRLAEPRTLLATLRRIPPQRRADSPPLA